MSDALVSRDAEQAVLGALLMEPATVVPVVAPLLDPESFAIRAHGLLYGAMLAITRRGVPLDFVALREELSVRGDIERVGGLDYLAELVDATPTAANAEHHAAIVRELAIRRTLIADAERAATSAADRSLPVERVVADAVSRLVATSQPAAAKGRGLVDLIRQVQDGLELQAKTGSAVRGVASDLTRLDALTRGFQPGTLTIVAARPSVGKSSFALHCARAACRADVPVFVDTQEMPPPELVERLTATEMRRSLWGITSPAHLERVAPDLGRAHATLAKYPLVLDEAGRTPALLRLAIQRAQAERGQPFGLVVVDYLGLMRSDTKAERHDLAIGEITWALTRLAKDFHVPVVALCQLNRRSVQDGKAREPTLADLRDSGNIEQDAHVVILLHRPTEPTTRDELVQIEAIVAKNRNGATGRVSLHLERDTGCWTEVAPDWRTAAA